MKRMSEVFELPITDDNLGYVIDRTTYEEDLLIINAINHVDALADALELLLSDKAMIHVGNDKHLQAKAALASYRGEA
jgi:hypothetical protein